MNYIFNKAYISINRIAKNFENITAKNIHIFRIRIKGGNVMEEEKLREKCIYYIRNKRRKKFLILFLIYQLMFFITVVLSLNFQLINIVYLIYCLDVDIIVSIFTYLLIYKKPKKNKNKDILMMFSLNVYPQYINQRKGEKDGFS